MHDTPLTFFSEPRDRPGIEIRVNFGVFAGRDATLAEVDELARELLTVLRRVSIVSLRRHELDREAEATIHQVKVEADAADALEPVGRDALAERLLALVDGWARRSIELRHADVTGVEALPGPVA